MFNSLVGTSSKNATGLIKQVIRISYISIRMMLGITVMNRPCRGIHWHVTRTAQILLFLKRHCNERLKYAEVDYQRFSSDDLDRLLGISEKGLGQTLSCARPSRGSHTASSLPRPVSRPSGTLSPSDPGCPCRTEPVPPRTACSPLQSTTMSCPTPFLSSWIIWKMRGDGNVSTLYRFSFELWKKNLKGQVSRRPCLSQGLRVKGWVWERVIHGTCPYIIWKEGNGFFV